MSIDMTDVKQDAPARFRVIAKYLKETDTRQFSELNQEDQDFWDYIYDNCIAAVPGKPLVGISPGNGLVVISWSDEDPPSESYSIYVAPCPLGSEDASYIETNGVQITDDVSPDGTYIDGLTNGSQYGVVMAGVNSYGQGEWSDPVYAIPRSWRPRPLPWPRPRPPWPRHRGIEEL